MSSCVHHGCQDLKETVEDLRETIETSQHPLVWKVRDAHDRIFSETDTAFALGMY